MTTMISNATLITVDPTRQIHAHGSIVIRGDKIVAVGPSAEINAIDWSVTNQIDGTGKIVLPGFVSIHNHLGYTVFRGMAEDIGHTANQGIYIPMSKILAREERQALAALTTAEMLKTGVTTVLQMEEDCDTTASAVEQSGIRALMGVMTHDIDVGAYNQGETVFDVTVRAQQLEQAITFAEHINGRANGRLGAVMTINMLATASPHLLHELRATADRLKVPLSLHIGIGEADAVRAAHNAEPFAYARDHGFLGEDVIAVHCYKIEDEDIPVMAETRTALAHCPLMNQFRGSIAPATKMMDVGVRVGLGIDNYFADFFEVLRSGVAVARIRADDPSIMQSPDALALATIKGADILGLGDQIGSLEVGKKADLQIIDTRRFGLTPVTDPVRSLVYHGHSKDIDLVMVNGQVVMRDGKVQTMNEEDLIAHATKAGHAAWGRFADQHGGYAVAR